MKKRDNSQSGNSIRGLLREKVKSIYSPVSHTKMITGISLIIFGIILLINGYLKDIIHFMNLGIGLIVVGWILFIFAYDRYIEYNIVSNVFDDYIDLNKRLIKGLDIKTSGVVIPPRENLRDGCIYLPLHENFKVNLSIMDDDTFFVNSDNRNETGILLSPLGRGVRRLLKRYRGEYKTSLEDRDINDLLDDLEYIITYLQVGGDVKVEIVGDSVVVSYRMEDNSLCKELQREDICRKCPCPVCGAIVLSVAEFLNKILKIESIKEKDKRVFIELKVIRDVLE